MEHMDDGKVLQMQTEELVEIKTELTINEIEGLEEIEPGTIISDLAEVEDEEVVNVATAGVVDNCIVSSADQINQLESTSLPQQILSTETEEDTEMIIDESKINNSATFVSIAAINDDKSSHLSDHSNDLDKDNIVLVHVEGDLNVDTDFDHLVNDNDNDEQVNKPSSSLKDSSLNGVPAVRLPFAFPGQSFNEQAQKLILNVWDFFKRAKKDPTLVHNLRGPQDHAAAALNVGTKTIGKIAKRVIRLGKLETPGKKRNRPKTVLDSVGAEGEEVLRAIIREMYDRRVAPTIPLVLAEAKTRINFKGSTTSLRRILKRMGYKYGGIDNSLIQSDKVNVSGWKEKSSKKSKPWRPNQPRKKPIKKVGNKEPEESLHVIEPLVPQIVESDNIIQTHEICQPDLHEVIIHYQKPDDAYISQPGQNQIITVTTDPSEIIQLQLDSNGETVPVTVVQEWQWQSLQKLDDVL